jgi:hypothetical protein
MAIVIDEHESGLDVEGSKLDALADLDEVCKTYPPLIGSNNYENSTKSQCEQRLERQF